MGETLFASVSALFSLPVPESRPEQRSGHFCSSSNPTMMKPATVSPRRPWEILLKLTKSFFGAVVHVCLCVSIVFLLFMRIFYTVKRLHDLMETDKTSAIF